MGANYTYKVCIADLLKTMLPSLNTILELLLEGRVNLQERLNDGRGVRIFGFSLFWYVPLGTIPSFLAEKWGFMLVVGSSKPHCSPELSCHLGKLPRFDHPA